MFGALFRRAEQSIDSAVLLATRRLVIAIPFLIGAGFAVAGLMTWLVERYGALTAYAAMTGLFLAIGVVLYIASPRTLPKADDKPQEQAAIEGQSEAVASPVDAELLLTAVTALGPAMGPMLLRAGWRNLPLILVVAAAIYFVSRFAPQSQTVAGTGKATDLASGELAY